MGNNLIIFVFEKNISRYGQTQTGNFLSDVPRYTGKRNNNCRKNNNNKSFLVKTTHVVLSLKQTIDNMAKSYSALEDTGRNRATYRASRVVCAIQFSGT